MEINEKKIWQPVEHLARPHDYAVDELHSVLKLWKEIKTELVKSQGYQNFNEKWIRRWSIETGIIERVYDISRGTTEVLVEEGFKASLIQHGETDRDSQIVIKILNDHFEAHDFLMDLIVGTRELSISWIKELHQLLTRHTDFTDGVDLFGNRVRVPLIKGDWKKQPNNPTREDGVIVEYCPPEQVSSEMENLIKFYSEIPVSLPEVRAAYFHHRFTQIHPFQDGNGRVARCLANLAFIKADGFPIIVQRDDRAAYISALEVADDGDLKKLIDLFVKLQKNAFLQAISVSKEIITDMALENILDAAESRIEGKRRSNRDKVDELASALREISYNNLESMKEPILKRLKATLPSFEIRVFKNAADEEHFYRNQILEIGKQFSYWVDLSEPRYWVKLRIRDGASANFVVALHQVGRPSQGTGVVIAFIEFGDPKLNQVDLHPTVCCQEPFIFTHEQKPEKLNTRFSEWLKNSFLIGLTEWQSRL